MSDNVIMHTNCFYKHIVVPSLLTMVLDLDKNYLYLDEIRSRKNLHKTIPNPKNIILRIQIKNSIFSWKNQLDAIQVSLVVVSNVKTGSYISELFL